MGMKTNKFVIRTTASSGAGLEPFFTVGATMHHLLHQVGQVRKAAGWAIRERDFFAARVRLGAGALAVDLGAVYDAATNDDEVKR
jgi:hypothetical protein